MADPTIIAHRGFAGVTPENTLAAARYTVDSTDVSMLEIDVQPAACGTPVVFHDERLDGHRDGRPTTDLEGYVRETSLHELRSADVLDSDEPIPTLEELLETVPETMAVNVELKTPGTAVERKGESLPETERDSRRAVWTPFVRSVVDDCDAFGGEVIFSSFYEGAIAALRAVEPRYAVAPLLWGDLEAGVEIARRYDCEAIHSPRNAIAGTDLAGTSYAGFSAEEPAIDLLEIAHEEGRTVNVWTVETWTQFDQLAAAGVDGIIADYPRLEVPTQSTS